MRNWFCVIGACGGFVADVVSLQSGRGRKAFLLLRERF